jgi:hypothetical protein
LLKDEISALSPELVEISDEGQLVAGPAGMAAIKTALSLWNGKRPYMVRFASQNLIVVIKPKSTQ